jgi:hypothetical protein
MAIFPQINENATDIAGLMQYVNILVSGNNPSISLLGVGILVVIAVVSFVSTKNYPFDRSLAFSAFLTSISAIFLRFLLLIGDGVLAVCVVYLVIALVILFREREVEEP